MVDIFQAVVLGVVEGVTEFIPVSSTGHMIIVGHLMGLSGEAAASFQVFIQLGAILAVVVLYKERFLSLLSVKGGEGFSGLYGIRLLALTTLPALFFGLLTHSYIKQHLFSPATVAIGLGMGGAIMILIEGRKKTKLEKVGIDAIRWKEALAIGFFQCLSLWPGVSRSGSTIIGGMLMGIERKTAAEYSFLAAVPVMFAAVTFDLYKSIHLFSQSDILIFLIGFIVSFIAAMLAIRFFIRLLGQVTFRPFGWYRIIVAAIVLWTIGRA
ncbi:MAG: undecaprenyl-diphosphate phosphatase [Nitrospirota bacterium]|mgnify:CR=1 FL=1